MNSRARMINMIYSKLSTTLLGALLTLAAIVISSIQ